MDTVDVSDLVYKPLEACSSSGGAAAASSSSILSDNNKKQADDGAKVDLIKKMLLEELPSSEQRSLDLELKWQFVLDKHNLGTKKIKANKRRFLTRKQRLDNNLLKLPKDGNQWNYAKLRGMREMWLEYMQSCLDLLQQRNKTPKCEDNEWTSFSQNLAKCELIGAELTIIRSKNNNLIGTKGTVVLETKETLQIVTPKSQLKILIKKESVFQFKLDGKLFTFFGKHLCTRPADRSSKKIKSFMFPDL